MNYRRLLLGVAAVAVGLVVAGRTAGLFVSDSGWQFVGLGAVFPALAVLVGVGFVVRGLQLLGDLE
jgi:hypothetical protein